MGFYRLISIAIFLVLSPLLALTPKEKGHIGYLLAKHEIDLAIKTYLKHIDNHEPHDLELLEEISYKIIEWGLREKEPEAQLLAVYGAAISKTPIEKRWLEKASKSRNPILQGAALQMASQLSDDQAEILLKNGLHSDYLVIRLETLFQLVARHSKHAMGYVESLKNLLPPPFHFLFPEFYALDGSSESITSLKQMTHDVHLGVRIGAILSAIKYHRDELLSQIRACLTHPNPLEQESSAAAIGYFKDLESTEKLKKLFNSNQKEVRLAAAKALIQLGFSEYKETIFELAKEKNPFAISLLREIEGGEEILRPLLQSENISTRFQATVSLLYKRDPSIVPTLLELLMTKVSEVGFFPLSSPGRTLSSFEVVFSYVPKNKEAEEGLKAFSLKMKEELLTRALELGPTPFLQIATTLFALKKTELIPILVRLLENLDTKEAIDLLKARSQEVGEPLIRGYASLALYRLNRYKELDPHVLKFVTDQISAEMIRFRPIDLEPAQRKEANRFTLTPQETAALLLESFEAISQRHEEEGLTLILKSMLEGHPNNRYALSGLLLKMIQ